MSDQLVLWTDERLADDLADRPRGEGGGAGRLLRDLVRRGLERDSLPAAAMLVVELDRAAGSRDEASAA